MVAAMLPSNSSMGFVAILGVLALIGILIRNSVILIVQIEEHRREGMGAWETVYEPVEILEWVALLFVLALAKARVQCRYPCHLDPARSPRRSGQRQNERNPWAARQKGRLAPKAFGA
ncbi:MAG: hypothetical protein ABI217_12520, partial [Chthoniobacterales bacterium]